MWDAPIILDTLPTFHWISRPDGECLFSNRSLLEAVGENWRIAVHPDDLQRYLNVYYDALHYCKPYTVEYRLRFRDGVYHRIVEQGTPLFDEKRDFLGVSCVIFDKTPEDHFRASVDVMLDCFGIYAAVRDENGTIIDFRTEYVNDAACHNNQMTREEQIGHGLLELLPAHKSTGLFDEYCQVIETGEPLEKLQLFYEDVYGGKKLSRAFDIHAAKSGDGFVVAWRDVTERQKAEIALREREQLLEMVIKSANLAIWIYDVTRQVHTLDEKVQRIFEINASTLTFDEVLRLIHPEDLNRFQTLVTQTLDPAGDGLFVDEYRIITPNKTVKWIASRSQTYFEAGKPVRVIGTMQDVTGRKRQLAEIEAIYNTAPVGLSVVDRDMRFVRVNRRLAEINGVSVQAHLGRGVGEIVPDLLPFVEPLFQQVLDTGQPLHNVELQGETPAQPGVQRTWLEHYTPLYDEMGQVMGVNVVVEEVTERKRREHLAHILQQLTSELAQVLTPVEIATTIINHTLDAFNAHLVGVGILNGDILEVYNNPGSVTDKIRDRYKKVPLNTPTPMTDAARTGQPVWIKSLEMYETVYPRLMEIVKGEDGTGSQATIAIPLLIENKIIGALGISFLKPNEFTQEDRNLMLTLAHQCALALERARLFEAEKAARLEAEKANHMKIQFLGMISHELRTPLTSIKGFTTTLLADDIEWDEKSRNNFLTIINLEADKLASMVEHLLELSRIQAGMFPIKRQPLPVQAVLDYVMPQLVVLTEAHSLVVEIPDTIPLLDADQHRIGQVITNLVNNAVKYCPPETKIHISAYTDDDQIVFQVSDQGPGIPAALRESVFEAFHQLPDRASKGAGLGLAICRGIIEAHNGKIWVADAPQGTTICFTLPVCP